MRGKPSRLPSTRPRQSVPRLCEPSSKAATNRAPIAWCRSPAARAQPDQPERDGGGAAAGGRGVCTEVQLLGPERETVTAILRGRMGFRGAAGARGLRFRACAACVHHSHPRDFRPRHRGGDRLDPVWPTTFTCAVQSGSSRVLERMQRLYTREGLPPRIEWIQVAAADIAISTGHRVAGFPARPRGFPETLFVARRCRVRFIFSFKYSPRPKRRRFGLDHQVPEKKRAGASHGAGRSSGPSNWPVNAELVGQTSRNARRGLHQRHGQWIGRTAQNRVLNFTRAGSNGALLLGEYLSVRVTARRSQLLAGRASNPAGTPPARKEIVDLRGRMESR